jgi:hypothetical protein
MFKHREKESEQSVKNFKNKYMNKKRVEVKKRNIKEDER